MSANLRESEVELLAGAVQSHHNTCVSMLCGKTNDHARLDGIIDRLREHALADDVTDEQIEANAAFVAERDHIAAQPEAS